MWAASDEAAHFNSSGDSCSPHFDISVDSVQPDTVRQGTTHALRFVDMTSLSRTFGIDLTGLAEFRGDLEQLEIPQYPRRVESDDLSDFESGYYSLLDPCLDGPLTDPDKQRDFACRQKPWIWNFHYFS